MATVNELKEELKFNSELLDLLEVMKNSAVFQFRALQRKKEQFHRTIKLLKEFFQIVGTQDVSHLFMNSKIDKSGIVIITSDKGFMGGLNLRVINTAIAQPSSDDAELIIIGERGVLYLQELSRKFTAFKGVDFEEKHTLASKLKAFIINGIKEERFGKVVIVYPKPISFMVQRIEVVRLLPLSEAIEKVTGHRSPAIGHRPEEVIIESPIEGIIEYLTEQFVLYKLLEVFEDSKLSEFAARAIHLEKSSHDLTEKAKYLKFRYFHAHHEVIDKGIRELFSAQIIRRKR